MITPSTPMPEFASEDVVKAPTVSIFSLGLVVLVLLLAAGVRLLGLGNTDLWGDEAFSVMLSLGPLSHILDSLAASEPHPPLYPFLLAGWLRLLGRSEMIARLPSAFAGIASVAVGAGFARAFTRTKRRWLVTIVPATVGLLVALNPIQVWYSQEARMYEQLSFFAGLASLALLRLWQGKRGSSPVYVLAILGAAGSHYYGLFVPLAHALAVLVASFRRGDLLRRWVTATAIAAVLYLPWVILALHVFTQYYGAQPGTVPLFSVALSSWVRVAAGWSLTWQHALLAAVVVSALIVFGLLLPARTEIDHFARLVLASWLFTPFVVGFLVSLVRPMYAERYLVVSSLPMVLLAGRGIVWFLSEGGAPLGHLLSRSRLVAPALGGMALLVALGTALVPLLNVWHGAYLKSAYNTHMREVDALSVDGDGVILDGISQTPLYDYYQKKLMPMYSLPDRLPLNPDETSRILERISGKQTGVWVFLYATPDYDPGYFIPRWLTAHAYLGFDQWAVNGRLQYYRFASPSALTTKTSNVRFGHSLLLTRYGWSTSGISAGGTIPVDLQWQWLSQAIPQPRVALRLIDSTGFTWAQTDQFIGGSFLPENQWPNGSSLDDRHGLMVPLGTPPGTYRLVLNVYGTGQSQPLPAQGNGAELGPDGVTVAQVQVTAPSQRIWSDGIAGYRSIGTSFAGQVALLGAAGSEIVTSGESGYLTLFWKALAAHPDLAKVRVALINNAGQVAEQRDLTLATSDYPASQWQPGDVLREQYRLPISAHLPPGRYRLTAVPLGSADGVVAPADLGTLTVEAGPPLSPDVAPQHPLEASFGGVIALTGYDLSPSQLSPGTTIDLTLHWKDLAPLDIDYTVFVHVLDAGQHVVAQRDQPPAGGQRPTSSWFPGDGVLDHYQISVPANLPAGDYVIETGLYNPADGKRLPVATAGKPDGDRVIVTHVQVMR